MYSTCIFCHADLGTNEAVEHFSVGRRLAFDAARGRLWVVCRRCERWNLTPLEERWEAIDECERLFRETRLRVSTDNIGLARIREGLELVRIGEPQRPEMAAWRYGDQFGRRRREAILWTGVGGATLIGAAVIGPLSGAALGASLSVVFNTANAVRSVYTQRRVRALVQIPDRAKPVVVRSKQLAESRIVPHAGSWALSFAYENRRPRGLAWFNPGYADDDSTALVTGDDALRAAAKLLPAVNEYGAVEKQVKSAVDIMTECADPHALFARFAGMPPRWTRPKGFPAGNRFAHLRPEERLALEMAAHEDSERRALEGELAQLEEAWASAEEIAKIADDLFVTEDVREKMKELKPQ